MYDAGKEDYLRPSQHIALCTIVAHNIAQNRLIEYGFNVPLNTLQVISGTGFYGSNDPTDSVKPMKEVVVLRIGFSPTRFTKLTMLQTYRCIPYTALLEFCAFLTTRNQRWWNDVRIVDFV